MMNMKISSWKSKWIVLEVRLGVVPVDLLGMIDDCIVNSNSIRIHLIQFRFEFSNSKCDPKRLMEFLKKTFHYFWFLILQRPKWTRIFLARGEFQPEIQNPVFRIPNSFTKYYFQAKIWIREFINYFTSQKKTKIRYSKIK